MKNKMEKENLEILVIDNDRHLDIAKRFFENIVLPAGLDVGVSYVNNLEDAFRAGVYVDAIISSVFLDITKKEFMMDNQYEKIAYLTLEFKKRGTFDPLYTDEEELNLLQNLWQYDVTNEVLTFADKMDISVVFNTNYDHCRKELMGIYNAVVNGLTPWEKSKSGKFRLNGFVTAPQHRPDRLESVSRFANNKNWYKSFANLLFNYVQNERLKKIDTLKMYERFEQYLNNLDFKKNTVTELLEGYYEIHEVP